MKTNHLRILTLIAILAGLWPVNMTRAAQSAEQKVEAHKKLTSYGTQRSG